ncbi:MAG: pro-sigmaK processing inhibitor BofA family protein [Clostridia bacterium]|nr:pro-sigmaK processing inhibitor BofA family protein [Clostridia bacterium]
MSDSINIAVYIAALVLLIVFARFFKKPLKIIFKLIANSALGLMLIVIINTFSPQTSLYVGINPVTAAVCGVLGVPGVLLLVLIKLFI